MSSTSLQSKSAGAGLFAAVVASLCCITPVLALVSGVSGIAATFSWMEPIRPYLIVLTIGVLGFAWYQKLRPRTKEEIECECDDDERLSFWQTKRYLGIVTVFAGIMLTFPGYSYIFYPKSNNQNAGFMIEEDTTLVNQVVIDVRGMTCTGCENHIEYTVNELDGVQSVDASYEDGTATVGFYPAKLKYEEIVTAINSTGYTVIEKNSSSKAEMVKAENISFYKVPLVCGAAPTLGCGSRSKPVLLDLEKSDGVKEAWLNRNGTVMAVLWSEKTDQNARREIVNAVFSKHQVNASELLMDDYALNYESFERKKDWFQGADVNQLSREEAGIFAEQLLQPIKAKTKVNFLDEQKLREKITDTFYDFFLHYESLDELGDPKVYQTKLGDIIDYGEDLLGEGSMPSVEELWTTCSNITRTCDHEECTGSSCRLTKKS